MRTAIERARRPVQPPMTQRSAGSEGPYRSGSGGVLTQRQYPGGTSHIPRSSLRTSTAPVSASSGVAARGMRFTLRQPAST